MKRSFDMNCAVNMINDNLSHSLPFQQKSFIKQKPIINNNSPIKKVISGCNLVESIMEGKWFSVDYQMQYFSMVCFVSLCYCTVIMPYVRAIFFFLFHSIVDLLLLRHRSYLLFIYAIVCFSFFIYIYILS